MFKSLLMASVLTMAFSGAAVAGDAPSAGGDVGCTGCGLPIVKAEVPVKLAQVRLPRDVGPAQQIDVPKVFEDGIAKSCCDPALNAHKFGTMFDYDRIPGSPLNADYGLKFLPTAAFKTAMNNTAFIVNTMLGLPYSHFIVRAQMRTDPTPNQAWPASISAFWTGLGPSSDVGPNHNLYVEDSTYPNLAAVTFQPYLRALMAPSHMKADGRRYPVKLTYWVAYQTPAGWYAREVHCTNVPSQVFGANINPGGMKVAPGQNPKAVFQTDQASPESQQSGISFGKPVPLTSKEIEELKLNSRKN